MADNIAPVGVDAKGMVRFIEELEPYPSIEELFEKNTTAIPPMLAYDIIGRYERLGPKYLTQRVYHDGRRVNGCMDGNSAQEAIEEIVDAIFNLLVLQLKGSHPYPVERMIIELVDIWKRLDGIRKEIAQEMKGAG